MQEIKGIISLFSIISLSLFCAFPAAAQTGFSIEGGLIYDRSLDSESDRAFRNLRPGIGYTANLGYDFYEQFGIEMGVMRSRHDYDLYSGGAGVLEEVASSSAFFIRLRGIPIKFSKSEIVISVGPGYFDITGQEYIEGGGIETGYAGWGVVSSTNYRYHISPGLAISACLGTNLVKYTRYDILGYKTAFQGELPRGNSIYWGLTLFHRIGNIQD